MFKVGDGKCKVKAIVCSKDTAEEIQQAFISMDGEVKKNILFSFGQVEGSEDISIELDQIDGNMAPEPIISDTTRNHSLIVWNLHGDSIYCENQNLCQQKLSYGTIFYFTKKEWRYNRNYDHFNTIDEDQLLKSKPKGCYLPNAQNIFLRFAALHGRRTVIFQK